MSHNAHGIGLVLASIESITTGADPNPRGAPKEGRGRPEGGGAHPRPAKPQRDPARRRADTHTPKGRPEGRREPEGDKSKVSNPYKQAHPRSFPLTPPHFSK